MIEGKTCLITGSTSGIGKEIALGLAKMKANVILVGRNKVKCQATTEEIWRKASIGTDKSRISYLLADLSSQASIHQLANEFLDGYESLDILINNAGVFLSKRLTTVDNIEYTFAVNHLAPFLLTNLLFEKMKASIQSRIVTTSSVAHRGAYINFDNLQFEKGRYNGVEAYRQSKLANILFTKELARRSGGSGVTSNCFHPGGVRTNLVQNNPWYYRLIWAIINPFLVSPKKGADTAIYLASSPKVAEISGEYFVKRKPVGLSGVANDHDTAARLWKISEELTGYK
ncbi:MAG TPA: SDR family oxidoreductase [Nitrososphaera sp.]|jgi:NAD(P)-dependent dehydrogenase (short-subunit alcohol dehydrogenase family)|nr:SDR family oxidoreductase [Nitrososphaera sp.]